MGTGYARFGRGPIRVLVFHGWFGDCTVFNPVLHGLDPELFSLALMDYRGYGNSRDSSGPFDIETIASDASKLADELEWAEFSVIGHSMGGKVALRVATDLGSRVARILALTPVWAGSVPFDRATLELFRSAAGDISVREQIVNHSTGGQIPAAWAKHIARWSMEVSTVEAFRSYFESWALSDFAAQASKLPQETLVVAGENDGGITEQEIRGTWLARLPNARLTVLKQCGHYPMLEVPLVLSALIHGFLSSPRATAA